jgi:hypothetical protein
MSRLSGEEANFNHSMDHPDSGFGIIFGYTKRKLGWIKPYKSYDIGDRICNSIL